MPSEHLKPCRHSPCYLATTRHNNEFMLRVQLCVSYRRPSFSTRWGAYLSDCSDFTSSPAIASAQALVIILIRQIIKLFMTHLYRNICF